MTPASSARLPARTGWTLAATLLALLPVSLQAQDEAPDVYAQGLEWREMGSPQTALELWIDAADSLFYEWNGDPRIGIAAIQVATEGRLREYYGEASQAYLRSFFGTDMERFGDQVEEEARRIQPLLPATRAARWDTLLMRRDPQILHEIRRFWIEKDPTPTTLENERLVEHWERIAYARRMFRNGEYTPYDTDDRGTVYVKYGEPGRDYQGNLGTSGSELRRWIQDPVAREALMRLDPNPSYAIWVYDTLNPRELVYFLFGNEDGTGRFRQLDGVRDLMYPAATSPNSRRTTPGNIRASHYLELFYYSELARAGGHFSRRYTELEQLWGQAESRSVTVGSDPLPTEGSLETFSYRFQQEDEQITQNPFRGPTVPEYSDVESLRPSVELVAYQTRLLSEDNQPRVVFTALSAPRTFIDPDEDVEGVALDERGVRHILVVRDTSLVQVGQLVGEEIHYGPRGISTFALRHTPEPLHFTMVAQLVSGGGTADASRPPGKVSLPAVQPLETDPDSLEVSDLVIGIEPHPGVDVSALAFPVLPARVVWPADPVQAYLEVYHLALRNGVGRYRAAFRVTPWNAVQGRPAEGVQPTTLSFELESPSPTAREVLDLGIENLPAGHYQVAVTITDLHDGSSRSRDAVVEVGTLRAGRH